MNLWSIVILAICLLSAFIVAWMITHPAQTLRAFHLIKLVMVIGAILLPIAWAQEEEVEIADDVKPFALGDGHNAISKIILSNWQDEDAWRAGMLSWLAWLPGNNSTNRSIA